MRHKFKKKNTQRIIAIALVGVLVITTVSMQLSADSHNNQTISILHDSYQSNPTQPMVLNANPGTVSIQGLLFENPSGDNLLVTSGSTIPQEDWYQPSVILSNDEGTAEVITHLEILSLQKPTDSSSNFSVRTDKYSYTTGEWVQVFGYLKANGTGVPSSEVCVEIQNPTGVIVFSICMLTDSEGLFGISWLTSGPVGTYTVFAEAYDFNAITSTTFLLSAYAPLQTSDTELLYTTSFEDNYDNYNNWVQIDNDCGVGGYIDSFSINNDRAYDGVFSMKSSMYTVYKGNQDDILLCT